MSTDQPLSGAQEAFDANAYLAEATAPLATLSGDEAAFALRVLAQQVSTCQRCTILASTRQQTVFGSGKPTANLMFIGEAPGAEEDASGLPFVGTAGQLLSRMIEACGLKRDDVYIANILKCRPPNNRRPEGEEAQNCRAYLDAQLALVRPRFVCALGATAAQQLLGTSQGIGQLRGRLHTWRGISLLCTYHPSFLLREPSMKREAWKDLCMLMAAMGHDIPAQGGQA